MDTRLIKDLAKKYSPEQIEGCITQQIETGQNICLTDATSEQIINELAKAEVIRELTDEGMSLADALREIARRMRLVQSGFQENKQ